MNQKINLLSKSISVLLYIFIGLSVLQFIYLGYFFYTDTSINFNTQYPDAIIPIYSYGRQSGIEVNQSVVEAINVATSILLIVISYISYFIIAKIFSDLANSEVPFKNIQVKMIYILSGLFFASFVIYTFLPSVLYIIFLEGTYLQLNLDGGRLLIALAIYTLAEIFKYGESLQKDVDETL